MAQTQTTEQKPDIIIVADFYAKDIAGGAELTTQALIDSAPDNISIAAIYSRDVTMEMMQKYHDCYWIFNETKIKEKMNSQDYFQCTYPRVLY